MFHVTKGQAEIQAAAFNKPLQRKKKNNNHLRGKADGKRKSGWSDAMAMVRVYFLVHPRSAGLH